MAESAERYFSSPAERSCRYGSTFTRGRIPFPAETLVCCSARRRTSGAPDADSSTFRSRYTLDRLMALLIDDDPVILE
jgi:hypothetical protein